MAAARAHADTFVAYQDLKGRTCNTILTGQDLGGMRLPPGVYCFSSSAQLTGTLVLTGAGPWIFQIGSTLTTATAAAVIVPPGGTCRASNVFWQVGSSATLGTATMFAGNILALTSITATTNATVAGRLLAINGAVTLDTNDVSGCGGGVPPPPDDDDDCPKHHGKCHCKCKHHDGRHDRDRDRDHHDCDRDGHGRDDGHHGDNDRDNDHRNDHKNNDKDKDHKDKDHDKDRKDYDNKDKDKNDKGRGKGWW